VHDLYEEDGLSRLFLLIWGMAKDRKKISNTIDAMIMQVIILQNREASICINNGVHILINI